MIIEFLFGFVVVVDINVLDVENLVRDEDISNIVEELLEDVLESRKGKVGDSVILDEFLSKIMSFLKDCILDVKLKVFKVFFVVCGWYNIFFFVECCNYGCFYD